MLLVCHQMEYQEWVPGHQTLLTLCVMVRYNEHKCCNLFQATKLLLRACRITKVVLHTSVSFTSDYTIHI